MPVLCFLETPTGEKPFLLDSLRPEEKNSSGPVVWVGMVVIAAGGLFIGF